ncbi:MAG: 16S rRNA (cytosine(967)-C(5))-methyltransferase RsmB [Desulfobulbaceae bacterium]|nr:16S rRNA (cytosine(967)-C(5))-methyltransferase RsmB [Desulfobulbaceae bacterium]
MSQCSRYHAIDILDQWQKNEQPVDLLLESRLLKFADARDRNLLKTLVFGVLRQRATLDWLLAKLSSTPLPRLHPTILQALRVGAYQILFLDRVPVSAAIHSTVEAVKQMGQPRWLTGFVNGVLRNTDRRKVELLAIIESGKMPAEARCNHPDWLLKRWRERYGTAGMTALCASNSRNATLCLRVNTAKITVSDFLARLAEQGLEAETGALVPEAVYVNEAGAVADLPGYGDGWFFVQDEIAQCIGGLVLPCPAGEYLDGCAGLGGKTAVLAAIAATPAKVVAVEPQRLRQGLFKENMARLGLQDVQFFAGSLREYALSQPARKFAAVLIDAPCSGLGVTGRHPDIRWQRQAEDLLVFQTTQVAILREAAPLLADGGVLVYATCSTEPEENEEVISLFLQEFPSFAIENAAGSLPASARHLADEAGFLRTVPGIHGSDGFFAARLQRVD